MAVRNAFTLVESCAWMPVVGIRGLALLIGSPVLRRARKRTDRISLEESSSGPPRKYYQLTKAGHAALMAQKVEWNGFVAAVARVLSDTKAAPAAKIVGVLK